MIKFLILFNQQSLFGTNTNYNQAAYNNQIQVPIYPIDVTTQTIYLCLIQFATDQDVSNCIVNGVVINSQIPF